MELFVARLRLAVRRAAAVCRILLIHLLENGLHGVRELLKRGVEAIFVVRIELLLRLFDGGVEGSLLLVRELVAVFLERLLDGEDEAVQLVAAVHLLLALLVLFGVLLGFLDRLVDLVLRKIGRRSDRDVGGLDRKSVV